MLFRTRIEEKGGGVWHGSASIERCSGSIVYIVGGYKIWHGADVETVRSCWQDCIWLA